MAAEGSEVPQCAHCGCTDIYTIHLAYFIHFGILFSNKISLKRLHVSKHYLSPCSYSIQFFCPFSSDPCKGGHLPVAPTLCMTSFTTSKNLCGLLFPLLSASSRFNILYPVYPLSLFASKLLNRSCLSSSPPVNIFNIFSSASFLQTILHSSSFYYLVKLSFHSCCCPSAANYL